ncbi:DUF1540 domain-containing protein [Solibacillus daqui]|uniref:DUF1540 domain-containing protein n=1 Tax=Solibacillus daqui TaxID=2912187 RepID=UPI0023661B3C|nr:DUF1540 domain-containing protein [Solibacillus daqui]
MPIVEVKCTVENCFYHEPRNICGAEKIEIHADVRGKQHQQTEFSTDFDAHTKSVAAHSKDTCCKTFISKNDKRTNA